MAATVSTDILNKIDDLWREEVDFLQEISRFPSVSGKEKALQAFLADYFTSELGMDVDRFTPDIKEISYHPGFSPPEWGYDESDVVIAKQVIFFIFNHYPISRQGTFQRSQYIVLHNQFSELSVFIRYPCKTALSRSSPYLCARLNNSSYLKYLPLASFRKSTSSLRIARCNCNSNNPCSRACSRRIALTCEINGYSTT
ncbi:hypothetical protein SAMN04488123_10440 [Natribacillus halophilus]|uniref:Uncharacterized protein n=1 Tax=Natribacillus halophilus TaxID=549003 RepID=A0A1G8MAN1_9BACI|nr:hypothetical protein SAMN04488123_10440 [Natribacillus halophilus]